MIKLESCPVCNTSTLEEELVFITNKTITKQSFESRLVECPNCSHVFLNPQPIWQELEPFYDEGYTSYQKEAEEFNSKNQTDKKDSIFFNPENGEFSNIPILVGGRFLDVGCGTGDHVATFSQFGMEAEGIEPSAFAAKKAQELGRKVFCGTLQEAHYPDSQFDVVSMTHVLEHVPQPLEVLQECYRILKPDGILVIGVPNFDSLVFRIEGTLWGGLQLPTHLHHFRCGSLSKAANVCDFQVTKLITESIVPFVEGELVGWIRRKFFIPQTLLLKTKLIYPLAQYIAEQGNKKGTGEAIVIHLKKAS
jgi:SAM-dependent methyltransferase